MILRLGLLVVAMSLAACTRTPRPRLPDRALIDVMWEMRRENGELVVDYEVTNRTDHAIDLLDRLLMVVDGGQLVFAPRRAVVTQGPTRDSVAFVRGYVDPLPRTEIRYPPAARRLEAGARARGSFRVRLPITAWHNFDRVADLAAPPTSAILEIGYLSAHESWETLTLDDDVRVRVPSSAYIGKQDFVTGSPKPIPPPPDGELPAR